MSSPTGQLSVSRPTTPRTPARTPTRTPLQTPLRTPLRISATTTPRQSPQSPPRVASILRNATPRVTPRRHTPKRPVTPYGRLALENVTPRRRHRGHIKRDTPTNTLRLLSRVIVKEKAVEAQREAEREAERAVEISRLRELQRLDALAKKEPLERSHSRIVQSPDGVSEHDLDIRSPGIMRSGDGNAHERALIPPAYGSPGQTFSMAIHEQTHIVRSSVTRGHSLNPPFDSSNAQHLHAGSPRYNSQEPSVLGSPANFASRDERSLGVASENENYQDFDMGGDYPPPDLDSDFLVREKGRNRQSLRSDLFSDIAIPEGIMPDMGRDVFAESDFIIRDPSPHPLSDLELQSPPLFSDPDLPPGPEGVNVTVRKRPLAKNKRLPRPQSVAALPKKLVNNLAAQFLQSKRPVSGEMANVLSSMTDEFFSQQVLDLEAYARHAGRKTIDTGDVILLMQRQKLLERSDGLRGIGSGRTVGGLFRLAHDHLPLENLIEVEKWILKREEKLHRKLAKRQPKVEDLDEG
ncbi:hypothetical protein BABINDRAFT_159303 [Babjeviella inositovora NRRL Y-12698]|uniref:CENP-T/Histone H4 histone fold domain-containing protein n=1 Tax=Babjeviella inositovora NRRL Y-12698 TaxID=984486 RepID=A0A1E3QYU9_9ASCO|nr:uncharacterized protein BABINDRAFT_159303 [Babjeviella inositovora NRRL Y-12698]ODQ82801.1 hypothetical protein BABINDRAFT_159303 [Babjeviella inositovora NRRL Y-12698]